ncbi:MAG: penicillin-binding protein 1A [Sinobacteraceae bacterium]|nr:penicillin-binding protein 1A [Nevskiaceae bacterium]MCP5470638.1 penicillin-binding protein 1A [Nevskiaceae bacterium]
MNQNYLRWLTWLGAIVIGLTIFVILGVSATYVYLQPTLPTVEAMRSAELQVPLRVYSRSGQLIAQIGEQRRIPVAYDQIPDTIKQAFIAAEDDRFFKHHGFDYQGILRSVVVNVLKGARAQGASTITMQTARNLFLSQDRTWRRKLQEVFLTYRLEHEFSKAEILGLYLNVISFGKRAYGVAAAAETYFGKTLDQLTLAEAATLARVPQAPSRYNPISDPEAAAQRRGYVLRRMTELGFIDAETARAAAAEKVKASIHSQSFEVDAPYVAEMVRLEVVKRFGATAQDKGYKVYTTIDSRLQAAANRALRLGLVEYDRRHGWRGAQNKVVLKGDEDETRLAAIVEEYPTVGLLDPALVVEVAERSAKVFVRGKGFARIDWNGLSWARRSENELRLGPVPKTAADVLSRGDLVYVVERGGLAQLVQVPDAEAALVALDPNDGAIAALVGGFDYFDKGFGKFNRATQAKRQPGSGFKPFVYSAALENGFTPSSMIMDSPFIIDGPGMEEAWRPENSSRQFYGPTRFREALVKSRNLVSIRILQAIGTRPVIDHATRFGFPRSALPANLTLALGTLQATPLEVAAGFAVFANGGYRVPPYFIERIEDPQGEVVYDARPKIAAPACESATADSGLEFAPAAAPAFSTDTAASVLRAGMSTRGSGCLVPPEQLAERAISAQNAWLIDSMLADVITRGTGRRALALGRSDIAGKTGTTNDAKDAWFNGFTRDLVASVWVGFDQERSLGAGEEGGRTAVPIWVHFMREALRGVPQRSRPMPAGLVQVRISPYTGQIASVDDPEAIFETFMADRLPQGGVLGGGEDAYDAGMMASPGSDGMLPATGDPAGAAAGSEPLF